MTWVRMFEVAHTAAVVDVHRRVVEHRDYTEADHSLHTGQDTGHCTWDPVAVDCPTDLLE